MIAASPSPWTCRSIRAPRSRSAQPRLATLPRTSTGRRPFAISLSPSRTTMRLWSLVQATSSLPAALVPIRGRRGQRQRPTIVILLRSSRTRTMWTRRTVLRKRRLYAPGPRSMPMAMPRVASRTSIWYWRSVGWETRQATSTIRSTGKAALFPAPPRTSLLLQWTA